MGPRLRFFARGSVFAEVVEEGEDLGDHGVVAGVGDGEFGEDFVVHGGEHGGGVGALGEEAGPGADFLVELVFFAEELLDGGGFGFSGGGPGGVVVGAGGCAGGDDVGDGGEDGVGGVAAAGEAGDID